MTEKIGVIGLGKLGLPVAATIALRGFDVMGYDSNPDRMTKEPQAYVEAGPDGTGDFNPLLAQADSLHFGTMKEVCDHADIIFIAVQTPHNRLYEGISPIPDKRIDFDYTYLKAAIAQLASYVRPGTIITVISTCLPGTMRREILPLIPKGAHFVYNPFFIAMGTVMRDFLHPEFVLIGADDLAAAEKLDLFYKQVCGNAPCEVMSIESAELTKVAYNTYIGFKITYANTLMEICNRIPQADVDSVTRALKKATRRLISPAYLSAGMGDGGGCHPRDNIAMSWLARKHNLSFDLFESVIMSREKQAKWLADILIREADKRDLHIAIMGYAFKPNTKITTGSSALLVRHFLNRSWREVQLMDPVIGDVVPFTKPVVCLIGCRHDGVEHTKFPPGSVVIDPFRIMSNQNGVQVIRLGAGTRPV